jgi:hypothetical protein
MRMTIALFSALALGTMTSVVLGAAPVDQARWVKLTNHQMDGVKAGATCPGNPNCVQTGPKGQLKQTTCNSANCASTFTPGSASD